MPPRLRIGRGAAAAGIALALALTVSGLTPTEGRAATAETLSVNLASATHAPTDVGEGFLYGLSQDGSSPADNYLEPLDITLMRGGGARVAGDGWIGDGYTDGPNFRARLTSALDQAKRVTEAPYHAEYVLMLSDLWGADLTQSSSALYPCNNGDCSNWLTFIQDVVAAVKAAGVSVTYEPYNEPNGSNFFPPGIGTQYYELWNSGFREIRSLDPSARIEGPAFASGNPIPNSLYQSWLATVKADGTVPNVLSIHLEADGNDPVTAAQQLDADLAADSIAGVTLSANEFLPQDQQNTADTAWYLDRFAQSGFATAARGEWNNCCASGDEGTILDNTGGDQVPSGQWWAFRAYADLTGQLVAASGQNGTTVTAAEDSSKRRAVALVADDTGYEGPVSLSVSGLGSTPYLVSGGQAHVEVDRIHDQSEWSSPQAVYSANLAVSSSGSITVPFEDAGANDAYVAYITPPQAVAADTTTDDTATSGTDHFAYAGTWGTPTGVSDLYGGTAHWSTTSGSAATYTFTGTQVAIHGVRDVDQGIAAVSVDSGPVTYVDDYSPSRLAQATLWSSPGLTPGTHTVTVTVTGTKNSGSTKDIIALDYATVNGSSAGTATADDTATSGTDHFTYGANWGTAAGVSDLYDGTAHWNSTAGSTATFTFTGTSATIYGVKDADQGIATYAVDGGTARSVDDYSPARLAGAPLFTVSGLAEAVHTVTINVTGTKNSSSRNDIIALDYAIVS